jgi:hypothetical protein
MKGPLLRPDPSRRSSGPQNHGQTLLFRRVVLRSRNTVILATVCCSDFHDDEAVAYDIILSLVVPVLGVLPPCLTLQRFSILLPVL